MFHSHTLAGIIRIHPELLPTGGSDGTLADVFETWGRADALLNPQRHAVINRLAGGLAGPRQHKLRANLQQLQAELARELAGFVGSAEPE